MEKKSGQFPAALNFAIMVSLFLLCDVAMVATICPKNRAFHKIELERDFLT
jgi:hypothetical protein